MSRPNLSGQRFGKLTAIEFRWGSGGWWCVCDCGNERGFSAYALTHGNNSSCGCLSLHRIPRERHGMKDAPEYIIWVAMIKRCENPNDPDFKHYGARGIKVCERWRNSFSAFYQDVGPRPDGRWIERRENSKGYEPGNVIWETPTNQQRNRRGNHLYEIEGVQLTAKAIYEKHKVADIAFLTFRSRLMRGWSVLRALSHPLREKSHA